LVVSVSLLCALGIVEPANAGPTVPFTMVDEVIPDLDVFTFKATGPLCASGTFVDDVNVAAFAHSDQARSGGGFVLIRSVYTCDDGSGTFEMLKHLTLNFTEDGFTDAGPVQILRGTGAYARITGHGFTNGGTDFVSGIGGGTTTGVLQPR
jgi:hypothetical protein